ncbi:MAG: tetratricopeptide repeat protein [Terracidiphilus sp.]
MQAVSIDLRRLAILAITFSLAASACSGAPLRGVGQQGQGDTTAAASQLSSLKSKAIEEGEANQTQQAVADFKQALALDPAWKEGWWNLGMIEYEGRMFKDAAPAFQRVTSFAPGLNMGWSLLGLSEFEAGEYDQARADLQKAQSLGFADDAEIVRVSIYHLSLLLIRNGQFDEASDLLRSNLSSASLSDQVLIALGLDELRAPLLPRELDPSREDLVAAVGEAAAQADLDRFAELERQHPDLPYLHLAYGRSLAQTGHLSEAEEQFLVETKISPDSAAPWIELCDARRKEGHLAEALEAAREAVAKQPQSPQAHMALASALEAAGKNEDAGREKQAAAGLTAVHPAPEARLLSFYKNNSGAVPASKDEYWNQARRAYIAGDYSQAAIQLKAWLAVMPEDGTGWALLGLCEYAQHDNANALIHLDRSARLGMSATADSIDQARLVYGTLLVSAGRFDEAETVLTSAAKSVPLKEQVEFSLGLALLHRAELPTAVDAADSGLVKAAGQVALQLEQSQYDQAMPGLQSLVKQYPAAPFLHYAYGTALLAISQFDQASAEFVTERALSPKSELPCLRLASIELKQHQPEPAAKWAQCAIQLAPQSADAHYLLGRSNLESGDANAAITELETAERLSPESPEIHFNLARAYARAKMDDKAQREREIFSTLSSKQQQNAEAPR